MSTTSTSTTNNTTTTNGSPPPVRGPIRTDDLAAAFAALRRVGKARPVTVHPYPARGIIALAVRVTPSRPDDGSVYVNVPADTFPDSGPWVMAAGVLDVPIRITKDGRSTFDRHHGETTIDGVPIADSPTLDGFALLPPGVCPAAAERADRLRVRMPAAPFSEVAARVSSVASKDRTRPVLTGVLLDYSTPGALMLAATDSFRMVLDSLPVKGSPGVTAIVPAAAVARAGKEAGRKGKGRPAYSWITHLPGDGIGAKKRGWTTFDAGDVMVTAPGIDGQYPDYRQLIPPTFDSEVTINRESIAAALESVAARMKVAHPGGKGGAVVLSTISPIAGQVAAFDALYDGPTITATFRMSGGDIAPMGLNPAFLAGLVRTMIGPTFTLGVISPLRPILATHDGAMGPRVLLMPILLPA